MKLLTDVYYEKVLVSLLLPALVLAGCTKEEIIKDGTDNGSTQDTTLEDPQISWSSSSLIIVVDQEDFELPTLNNPHGFTLTYASSDSAVATITADGTVTVLNKVGATSISASFAGNDTYAARTVSYSLVVTDGSDDGAVALSFDSAGSGDDDDISNTGFSRLVTVTYSSDGASVSGYSAVADVMNVSVSGARVTINYSGAENVVYKLSGSSSNGQFKLYSEKKQAIWLSGLSLTNPDGAAIDNQSGKRTFIYVDGSNTLSDGSSAAYATSGDVDYDDEDGEYTGTAGIKADNYFGMTGGTVTITNTGSGGKGLSAGSQDFYSTNGSLTDSYISGGTLTIKTSGNESNDVSAKGVKIGWSTKSGNKVTAFAGNVNISGGSIVVSSSKSEAFEAKGNLNISGGSLYASSNGDDAINSGGELNITGGYVYAYSSANDAMDANHDFTLSGGYVFVAYGGLENGYSASQTVYSMSGTAGSWNALYNGSSFIAAFKAPSGASSFAVSAPSLSSGYKGVSVGSTTYCNDVWATSGISGGSSVSLSTYSGGQGGPGGHGGPGGGGRPW